MTFKDIYSLHKNLVFNLALQYVQNQENAEEITQDVFVSVYENLQNFQQESDIKTWVYRIAINKSLDFLRAKKRKKRNFFLNALGIDNPDHKIEIPNFKHPGVLLEEKESMAKIFQGINQLPDKQKTALILLKIEQKSQVETAEIMELSIKAVESLYQRAKKNLKNILYQSKG